MCSQKNRDIPGKLRWFQGLCYTAIFTMTYILAPLYIITSILALLCRYPTGKFAGVYALPLIISILTPSHGMPGIVGMLSPMIDYFDYESIFEDREGLKEKLEKGERYIFCCQPHGIISFCGMCSAIETEPQYRKIPTAVASALIKMPILKNVMGIFGLTDASRKNLSAILKREGIDGCVVLYVGGKTKMTIAICLKIERHQVPQLDYMYLFHWCCAIIFFYKGMAELFKSSREEERLHLSERKGFIKLALREGVDIVPVYLFGNTSILDVVSCKTWFNDEISATYQSSSYQLRAFKNIRFAMVPLPKYLAECSFPSHSFGASGTCPFRGMTSYCMLLAGQ